MSRIFFVIALVIALSPVQAHAQTPLDLGAYLDSVTGAQEQASGAPAPVDLLFEGSSYVPPFYRGRPLPSPGSLMRFQAIAHFADRRGTPIPESKIDYTWRRSGQVEGAVSGVGRSSVFLQSPTLFGTDTISVDARATDGSVYGTASMTLPSVDPGATLYQDHPLYGIEYYDALPAQASIQDVEMTFAAVPYFVPFSSADDRQLVYAWSVNGIPVSATTTGNNEITVNAQNSSGLAALALLVTSPRDVLLSAQSAWNILFSRSAFVPPQGAAQ